MQSSDLEFLRKKALKIFVWRLFGLITIASFLILDLIFIINNIAFLPYDILKTTNRLSFYYSYFTTQTNYIVLIYLFVLLFEKKVKKNNQPANFFIFLAVTVYITITILIFWLGLFTNAAERSHCSDLYNLIKTIIIHLIMPITMITSFVLTCGHQYYSLKEHHKLYLWFILFYPAFYLVYILVRGNLRWKEGFDVESYPYPFFNYHQNGIGFLIIAIIAIIVLVISLQYFYMWINNICYKKKHYKSEEPPQSKITYTYQMNKQI